VLELDAPHTVKALNTGTPAAAVPLSTGYVLIPTSAGAKSHTSPWIGIERSHSPSGRASKTSASSTSVSLRKMSVSPGRDPHIAADRTAGTTKYELSRVVVAFPSLVDQVLVPTPEQIEAICRSQRQRHRVRNRCVPLSSNAPIMVDPTNCSGGIWPS